MASKEELINLIKEWISCDNKIKQINHSFTSQKGAIRGLHMQLGTSAEYKVISCISGKVFDDIVNFDLMVIESSFWCLFSLSFIQGIQNATSSIMSTF